jgi:hypothetical protein
MIEGNPPDARSAGDECRPCGPDQHPRFSPAFLAIEGRRSGRRSLISPKDLLKVSIAGAALTACAAQVDLLSEYAIPAERTVGRGKRSNMNACEVNESTRSVLTRHYTDFSIRKLERGTNVRIP